MRWQDNTIFVNTYKTKLKLDKEVGVGGGMSERTREPNERTRGTGALMSL